MTHYEAGKSFMNVVWLSPPSWGLVIAASSDVESQQYYHRVPFLLRCATSVVVSGQY